MLVTSLGLLLVLLVSLWVAWPLIATPAGVEPGLPLVDEGPARSDAERRRDAALAAIREAEFDHQVGKLSDEDFEVLRADLEEGALAAIAEIEGEPGSRETAAGVTAGGASGGMAARGSRGARVAELPPAGERKVFCASCGKALPGDARFCHGCGKPVAARGRSRRRSA